MKPVQLATRAGVEAARLVRSNGRLCPLRKDGMTAFEHRLAQQLEDTGNPEKILGRVEELAFEIDRLVGIASASMRTGGRALLPAIALQMACRDYQIQRGRERDMALLRAQRIAAHNDAIIQKAK